MRRSRPMPSATRTTSAPVASQTFAISLMNEMRVISAAFAASLIISAEATSQRTIGAVDPGVQRRDGVAVLVVEGADDDPVRVHEVRDRGPFRRELRVRDVADLRRARARRADGAPSRRCRPGRCSSSRRRSAGRSRAARRRRSRPRRGRRRRSTSAACRRRRRRSRRRRSPRRRRVVNASRSALRREQLVETGLVDRNLARAEARRSAPEDVADDDRVAELGEAGTRDEADVAGAEDGDACGEALTTAGAYRRAWLWPVARFERPAAGPSRSRASSRSRAGRAGC